MGFASANSGQVVRAVCSAERVPRLTLKVESGTFQLSFPSLFLPCGIRELGEVQPLQPFLRSFSFAVIFSYSSY